MGEYTLNIYNQMLHQIDRLRQDILQIWRIEVKKNIKDGMAQPLLVKDADGTLSVNFNQNLKNALKDTKYIMMMGLEVTNDTQEFFNKEEQLWVRFGVDLV